MSPGVSGSKGRERWYKKITALGRFLCLRLLWPRRCGWQKSTWEEQHVAKKGVEAESHFFRTHSPGVELNLYDPKMLPGRSNKFLIHTAIYFFFTGNLLPSSSVLLVPPDNSLWFPLSRFTILLTLSVWHKRWFSSGEYASEWLEFSSARYFS